MARRTVTAPIARSAASARRAHPMPTQAPGTACVAFRAVPTEGRHLLAVMAGIGGHTARREAADLEDAVRRLLADSIESGADGSRAFLCEFALEAAKALRQSADPNG